MNLLSKLGLGASQFPSGGSVRGRPPEAEVRDMLLAAGRAGLGFLDAGQAQPSAEQMLGARFAIRSIPTLALFREGREVARQAGALGREQIVAWARAHAAS